MAGGGWKYQSAQTLGTVLISMLFLCIAADAMLCAIMMNSFILERAGQNGADIDVGTTVRMGVIALSGVLVYCAIGLATLICYCMWIYRANTNARALGCDDLTFTPGWSAGWVFIPFANLVKPFQAVREIWNASEPDDAKPSSGGKTHPLIATWWGLLIVGRILDRLTSKLAEQEAGNPNAITFQEVIVMISAVSEAGAAMALILLVRELHRRQEKRRLLNRKFGKSANATSDAGFKYAW